MSTKVTISYDDVYHLYQECYENDNVHLRLDPGKWSMSFSSEGRIDLHVDVTLWRNIVSGWLESEWGKNSSMDHEKIEFDPEVTNQWLERMRSKRDSGT